MVQIIQPSDTPDPLGPAGLGNVPTLGGNVSTAIPPAPGVPSAVQGQQSAGTATQAVAQAIVLPPLPYAVFQRLDPSGSLTMWGQTLYRKLGGYSATPVADAELLSDWGSPEDSGARAMLAATPFDWPEAPTLIRQDPTSLDLWDSGEDTKAWVKGQSFLSSVSVAAPLTGAGTAGSPVAIPAATGAADGYLSAAAQTIGGAKTFAALSTFQSGINLGNENLTVYDEGTWAPSATNLGGTGISYTTAYTRVGNRVDFTVLINGTGMTATANSTYITLPFTPAKVGACAFTNTSVGDYGPGLIYTDGRLWLPTIASTTTITASGTFFV